MRPRSSTTHSRIDGQAVHVVERLADRFVDGWVRVDGVHHRLDRRLRLHRGDGFGDDLESLRADDVDAQNLAVLLVGHYLDESVVRTEDGGLAVRGEGKLSHL